MAKPRIRRRTAFTLMEISLVLFILVVMAALAAPSFQGVIEQQRLLKAAESIAADWTYTRATAMETGATQAWACELGEGNYSASAATSSSAGSDASGAAATMGSADLASAELTEALPEGYVISELLTSESNEMSSMGMSAQTSESGRATVFFYPDGTCSNARLTVHHQDTPDYSMSVVMNGLAGTVRVLTGSTSSGTSQ